MTNVQPEAEYRAHLAAGRFMIQRSLATGRYVFYPRIMVPGDGAQDLEWVPASGRGVVYSTTLVNQKPPTPSYNVTLVQLDEGCRMMSRVDGIPPDQIRIGMAVQARIIQEDGAALVVFVAA